MARQGTVDTESFNGNPPMNNLLQGLDTIYAKMALQFLVVCSDKVLEIEKFFRDFLFRSTSSLGCLAIYM